MIAYLNSCLLEYYVYVILKADSISKINYEKAKPVVKTGTESRGS